MHIGIDCRLPTYQMGGISQYIILLIQAMGKIVTQEQVTIFHSRKEARAFLPANNALFSRSDLWTPCHHRLERKALSLELFRHKLDIFHSPDFIPPQGGFMKRIITVHDLTFLYYPEFLTAESRRYYLDQIEWAVSAADHIIADSEATRQDLIRMLSVSPPKATTIYLAANPVYEMEYKAHTINDTMDEYGLERGFILNVGTLEPRKNLPTLLRAYARLRKERKITVPLVLVGNKGWIYEEVFATIDSLGLKESVRHLSGIPDEKLAHLYHLSGVLAFPSYYEGFGLPALEAMHCGCPVIASNRGSLPEVTGNAGVSLPPDDEDAWVDGIAKVLEDADFAEELRKEGRQQARRFTWENAARETLEVYRAWE